MEAQAIQPIIHAKRSIDDLAFRHNDADRRNSRLILFVQRQLAFSQTGVGEYAICIFRNCRDG